MCFYLIVWHKDKHKILLSKYFLIFFLDSYQHIIVNIFILFYSKYSLNLPLLLSHNMTNTTTQRNLTEQAKNLIIYAYEYVNWTNCYGYQPQKNTSLPYMKAKRKALKICKNSQDTELYTYIKNNL